mmetsp:Transcript_76627/g.228372  ORF Transcript_76627/g.228372 Transcript_76627/m.228372 type:complete len:320 (+) Transcript_76627:447-1406(+)
MGAAVRAPTAMAARAQAGLRAGAGKLVQPDAPPARRRRHHRAVSEAQLAASHHGLCAAEAFIADGAPLPGMVDLQPAGAQLELAVVRRAANDADVLRVLAVVRPPVRSGAVDERALAAGALHVVHPDLSSAGLRVRRLRAVEVSELAAYHRSGKVREVVIADSAPLALVVDLHPPTVNIHQPDLALRRTRGALYRRDVARPTRECAPVAVVALAEADLRPGATHVFDPDDPRAGAGARASQHRASPLVQLAAYDPGLDLREATPADGAPLEVVEHLHPAAVNLGQAHRPRVHRKRQASSRAAGKDSPRHPASGGRPASL